jgi:hypothetical protein
VRVPDLPDAKQVMSASHADEVAEFLRLADSSRPSSSWWTALISSCSSGFAAAGPGSPEMMKWGEVLLDALRAARIGGGLPWEETLHREVVAKLAMVSAGVANETIHAGLDGVWEDFVRDVTEEGENPEDLRSEISSIRAAGVRSVPPVRVHRIHRIRFTLREIARYREQLSDDAMESFGSWEHSLAME